MVILNDKEAYTDQPEAFKIYRLADPTCYFSRCTLLESDTKESFAEITIEEYNKIQEEEQAKYNLM